MRYDICFLKWYSEKFLRGDATTDECEPLFKQYKQCLGTPCLRKHEKIIERMMPSICGETELSMTSGAQVKLSLCIQKAQGNPYSLYYY
ncbi:hypothetical protein AOQ84DRAFT_213285 [Glonium stellatum]|uniref:Uncharacterized protein n=1 Tax=Glonium stellatum TaxID=574774 RepID=A0A8E2JLK2_9PEZI|nr:hypothetical protein AOQ84DRAFT_213285 [Glonium stellatum]